MVPITQAINRLKTRSLFIVLLTLASLILTLSGCVGQAPPQAVVQTGVAAAGATATDAAAPAEASAAAVPQTRAAAADLGLDAAIPVDPQVRMGTLENGLTYYIRPNRKPANRAELRLVVNAGSVLEEEDQLGLAHFVEHMAFNGTENFAKQEIVDYLESIGMPFGPEVNAYTGYDETVYLLQIPTEDAEVVETAVQILEEWAHRISFEPEEVVKERPIIVEEWRLGRGAEARMRDRQYPILWKDSRYAERRPIGKVEAIEKADAEALRRFYRDWYRPELMAVVAVGDFDPARIEELVRRYFGRLEAAGSPKQRPLYPVPEQPGTLYAPATDPEATSARVALYAKRDPLPQETVRDYRRSLVEAMYNGMLNERFQELARSPESPFIAAGSLSRRLIRPQEAYLLLARVREGRILDSLDLLLAEAERVRRYGFTLSELARMKERLLTGIEQAYRDRDNIESETLTDGLVAHFLEGEPIPDLEFEYRLFQEYLPGIGLEDVNALAAELLPEDNRVVLVNAPADEAALIPQEAELQLLFEKVASRELAPYQDRVLDQPLFTAALDSGARVSYRSRIEELGVEELGLSNGVRLVLKATDFKEEEILFGAFSPGGHSLVSNREFVAAVTASSVVKEGGLNGFDQIQLQKKLAGKTVSVSPWIGELYEGMRGSTRPQDLETLLQLIYLYFAEPRQDEQAYRTYKQRLTTMVENREASPGAIFWDAVSTALAQNHFRARPWTKEVLEEMDLDTSLAVYRERFGDAGDFTFVFVGNFRIEEIEPLLVSYLGSLPGGGRVESWRDLGMDPPSGVVEQEVRKGLEPQSRVQIVFSGTMDWSLASRLELEALKQVLDIKLRESVREEAGGSYDVGVDAELNRYPDPEYFFYIGFGCAPEQVESLSALVFEQVADLRERGPAEKELGKVREILRREHERNLKENDYWLGSLQLVYLNDLDPRTLLAFDRRLEGISLASLKGLAREILDPNRYLRVVLYPEEG